MQDQISPDVSLAQDESFVATSYRGLIYPLGDYAPPTAELQDMGGGVRWLRLALPFSLGHINCWILNDSGGVAIVDTGMNLPPVMEQWDALFDGALKGVPVTRVIGTHMHPDHVGLAGWLTKRFNVPLWMTRGEWLTVQLLRADARAQVPDDVIAMRRAAGWSEEQIAESSKQGWGRLASYITEMPMGYRRMQGGDVLLMGDQKWQVVIGSGHSPEHACLWNEDAGLLISGDQVLPRISSNVSLSVLEPEANPLGEWLASIDRLLELPDTLLVLPAHGYPFRGLHARLNSLKEEHLSRLEELTRFLSEPKRAVDCFSLLFRRKIEGDIMTLATGEALAHLRWLEVEGRAIREIRDGVWWYHAA